MLCTRDLLTLLCSSKSGFTLRNADLCPLCITLQLREKMLTLAITDAGSDSDTHAGLVERSEHSGLDEPGGAWPLAVFCCLLLAFNLDEDLLM